MAKLKISMSEPVIGESECKVTIKCSLDVKDDILTTTKEMFEIELLKSGKYIQKKRSY